MVVVAAAAMVGAGFAAEAASRGFRRPVAPPLPTAPYNPWRNSPKAWLAIFKEAALDFNNDRIPAAAAGVAYYGLLALFPAITAFVASYGVFGDIKDARGVLALLNGLAPPETLTFIGDEMVRIAAIHHAQLGATFAVGLLISIWSANAAMSALIGGLNVAYEEREKRNVFVVNLTSLGFTVGAIGLAVAASVLFTDAPMAEKAVGLGATILGQLRWPAMLLAVVALLATLYRYGPSRPRARWHWLSPGSVIAGAAWLGVSLAFSAYVSTFGHYDRLYGPLGAVVGLMVWLWISVMVILFGAELNSEAKRPSGAIRPGSGSA